MMEPSPEYAVEVAGVSKRYRFPAVARYATLKELVVRRVRVEGRYGIVDALDDVTFAVRRGQTLGIVGQNGSGKTTLLRVLCGISRPDRGQVRLRGSVAPLLALGSGFNPYLTGRENAVIELLTLGLDRREARRRLDDVIAFSELGEFIDAPMRTYSNGMQMRLAFAAATCVDPDILVVDEVLAVGDERFSAKCAAWFDQFKRRGRTVILVTHSLSTVTAQCDAALWLDNGRVAAFGEPAAVIHAYVAAKAGPMTSLPLVGDVRQEGTVRGGFADGWTNGALEFAVAPLRDVRAWSVRATIPAGMPSDATVAIELDGRPVASAPASLAAIVVRCNAPIPKGRSASVRIASSATVNHHALGIGDDQRDLGPRIDEIVFEHEERHQ
jgi:ABC-type polysaccharide/polyol phosphate transport system ATPase subunit